MQVEKSITSFHPFPSSLDFAHFYQSAAAVRTTAAEPHEFISSAAACVSPLPSFLLPLLPSPLHRMPSGLLGCSFGFPVGPCFDLGHLHICRGVGREAGAHALDGLLVSRPLLLQRADHVLHLALPRQEVLHVGFQRLDLLPRGLGGNGREGEKDRGAS